MVTNSKPVKHAQPKYFTLMLVPSHSSGKMRSLRIPQRTFCLIILSVITMIIVISSLYIRSLYFEAKAERINADLEQMLNEYWQLQETSELLSQELSEEISKERDKYQSFSSAQTRALQNITNKYQEKLQQYERDTAELLEKIEELQKSQEAITEKLSARGYTPLMEMKLTSAEQDEAEELAFGSSGLENKLDLTIRELQESVYVYSSFIKEIEAALERKEPKIFNTPTIWPVYGIVTSEFGDRSNPFGGPNTEAHYAIDIAVPNGTNVKATGGGTIAEAGYASGYGYLVVIDHGMGIQTYYGHNSKLLVKAGDRVERGDIIAKSGNTGRSTGPHVHYEVVVNGNAVNPRKYFTEG